MPGGKEIRRGHMHGAPTPRLVPLLWRREAMRNGGPTTASAAPGSTSRTTRARGGGRKETTVADIFELNELVGSGRIEWERALDAGAQPPPRFVDRSRVISISNNIGVAWRRPFPMTRECKRVSAISTESNHVGLLNFFIVRECPHLSRYMYIHIHSRMAHLLPSHTHY